MAGVTRLFSFVTAGMKLPSIGRGARGLWASEIFDGFTSLARHRLLDATTLL